MSHKGDLFQIGNRKIFLVRGIFDYFDKKNFDRLKEECLDARKQDAEFYVALYSDETLEKAGHKRKLKGLVKDEDRVFMLESLDFVDGAFTIDSPKMMNVEQALKAKLFDEANKEIKKDEIEKKYRIGYASGAFSNLHKGHVEHLREMAKQCQTVIVAVNSDKLIKQYKRKTASVDQETRKDIISHIKFVDMAIITDEYDKLKAVDNVKNVCGDSFDAIFVGSDWQGDPKWENFEKNLNEKGIDVVFTERPKDGISTTKIDNTKKKDEKDKGER